MTILLVVVALVIITAVSVFAVGDGGRMRADAPDREPADLPADRGLEAADVDRVRFAVGVRGYRMEQVDGVLDRVSAELTQRAEREKELADQIRSLGHEPVKAAPWSTSSESPGDQGQQVRSDADGEVPEPSEVAASSKALDAEGHG